MGERVKFNTTASFTAFGAVTGSYTTIFTPGGGARKLIITASFDQVVVISLDNGTTDFTYVPLGSVAPFVLIVDFGPELFYGGAANIVKIKHNGVAPTAGYISVNCVYGA